MVADDLLDYVQRGTACPGLRVRTTPRHLTCPEETIVGNPRVEIVNLILTSLVSKQVESKEAKSTKARSTIHPDKQALHKAHICGVKEVIRGAVGLSPRPRAVNDCESHDAIKVKHA